jgi:hypothetical protein
MTASQRTTESGASKDSESLSIRPERVIALASRSNSKKLTQCFFSKLDAGTRAAMVECCHSKPVCVPL